MPFSRRNHVLAVLRQGREPLDDDEIADLAGMNRVYVNALCRALAEDGLIVRRRGAGGKLVNVVVANVQATEASRAGGATDAVRLPRTRMRFSETQADRIDSLIAGFDGWVSMFESSEAFPGPSLYFHERAIARQRQHQAVDSLLSDIRFLEYIYAVLPAWGMHRMGPQSAKVGDFTQITTALREKVATLEQLWPLRITALDASAARDAAALAWQIIAHIRVSTSRTQIVAGSKFLHHLLPDLVVPIDRRYTFRFFTGYGAVTSDRASFLDWFPKLASIGNLCRVPIYDVIARGGFMATGEAKAIDNAIIGFIQSRQTQQRSALIGESAWTSGLPAQRFSSRRRSPGLASTTASSSSGWNATWSGRSSPGCGRSSVTADFPTRSSTTTRCFPGLAVPAVPTWWSVTPA